MRRIGVGTVLGAALTGLVLGATAHGEKVSNSPWWAPGLDRVWSGQIEYADPHGRIGVLNAGAPIKTKGNPFFEPMGPTGRACVTCHQPSDGMSLSLATIQQRWKATDGKDPLFAAYDGRDCPNLPAGDPKAHSMILKHGLIRVGLPWPPVGPDGKKITPEFDIEVVRDPTGCNTDPEYGLKSKHPTISVYRRPRPVANTKYLTADKFGVGPFNLKNSQPALRDPVTHKPVNMNMMADARVVTLRTQAISAMRSHLQITGPLDETALDKIVAFEKQIYVAQAYSDGAGRLDGDGAPEALGPEAMLKGEAGVLGNNTTRYVFPMGKVWADLPPTGDKDEDARRAFRESVQRGEEVFMFRTFWIKDAMHINTVGLGNPIKRTCATCHGMHMTGMDTANGWMDIGTTNLPWAKELQDSPWAKEKPDMPLFKLTCSRAMVPHPFLGRVIYTQDPGRALISGKCDDIGTIVEQQFRGLAARAPYFSNGSAKTLRELVDFYDRRFNIQFSEEEKRDLVNFLSTL